MIIDKELIFSDDQAITGDAASSVVVDSVKAGGPYKGLWFFVKTGSAADFDNLTSLNIKLQTSDDNFASDTTELFSVSVALADLTKDSVVVKAQVPLGVKQYLRAYYDVVGTNPTAGSVYAALVPDVSEGF